MDLFEKGDGVDSDIMICFQYPRNYEIGIFHCNYISSDILDELGMSDEVTVAQARKKWTQLVRRYLELKVLCGVEVYLLYLV